MKGIFMVLITFLTFSTVSFAQQLTPSELDFVFEGGDNLELAYLSDTEMQQTKGAAIQISIPFLVDAASGAAMAGGGYIWGYYKDQYHWDTSKFLGNTLMGAATGGYFGWGARMASGIGSWVWRANGWVLNSGLHHIWRR